MNRPNIFVRFFGSPSIALLVFAGWAYAVYDWRYGPLRFWVALIATGIAYRTLRCLLAMQSYKSWAREWRRLQSEVAGNQPATKAGTSKGRKLLAVLLLFALPVLMTLTKDTNQILPMVVTITWGIDILYVGWLLLAMLKRTAAGKEERNSKAGGKPVTWALGRASGSPSRAEIEKQLPAYALQLMSSNKAQSHRIKSKPTIRIAAH